MLPSALGIVQNISINFSVDLKHESNFFTVDQGINQKRTENCINARSAVLQTFSVLFWLIPRSNDKKLLSFNFSSIQQRKQSI